MNFVNLLAESGDNGIMIYILLGVMIVILIAGYFFSMRSTKKRQEQTQQMLSGIMIGTEVKTIGGIVGTVVEIDTDTDTFVICTGSDDNKSYMRLDRLAIFSADGKNKTAAPAAEAVEDVAAEEPAPAEATEEPKEESAEEKKD